MKMETNQIVLGWIVHLVVCFYLIRTLNSVLIRAALTVVPCLVFILVGCYNLPLYHMTSVMSISLSWMLMIRMIQLIVLEPKTTESFGKYLLKFLWLMLPILPSKSNVSPLFSLGLAAAKLFGTHWITQWLLNCPASDHYGHIAIFFAFICAGTFINDLQIALVRLLTRQKYTVLEFNHYPFFATSLREFWSRRYNLLVSTLLKESIFDPLRRSFGCSSSVAAFSSFVISAILHGHVALAGFGAKSPVPACLFFLLQGVACCVEAKCPFSPPKACKWIFTQGFLLLSAPLYLGLFTRVGPQFFEFNRPMFFDAAWAPKLPVPNFCP